MPVNRSITAVNSTFALSILNLFPVPQILSGYAMDDVFSSEPIDAAEVQMGVDGIMSAGFIFKESMININLQANSPSNTIFDQWRMAEFAAQEKYFCMGTLVLPALGYKLALMNGVMSKWPPFSDVKKVQQPRRFTILWERVLPAPA